MISKAILISILLTLLVVGPLTSATSQSVAFPSPQVEFITGPQLPLSSSWLDQTQLAKGVEFGSAFPSDPPMSAGDPTYDAFINRNYYDLALCLYVLYARTNNPEHLNLARKVADSWWRSPNINEGKTSAETTPSWFTPRNASLGGLILRAMDGRPEMWDWINRFTRGQFNAWCKAHINDPVIENDVRDRSYMLQDAVWLARVLPDSFPLTEGGTASNGAELRAAYLADAENFAVNYFGRLQSADGSYRADNGDYKDEDGGILVQVSQPFLTGILLWALVDVHRLTTNPAVKANVLNQIQQACTELYTLSYRRNETVADLPQYKWRSMWYFIHGGTSVNPKKWETIGSGSMKTNGSTDPIRSERQLNATILPAYGYLYSVTKDPKWKEMGDEILSSITGASDGIRAYADSREKEYSQTFRRAYLPWTTVINSLPAPTPLPSLSPSPTATPVPAPIPSPTPTVSPSPSKGRCKAWPPWKIINCF